MLLALALACSPDTDSATADSAGYEPTGDAVEVQFRARVNGADAACGSTLSLGTPARDAELLDLRMYVHGVEMLDAAGAATPLRLDPDDTWQRDGLALLDFEDDSGACDTGSASVNRSLRGHVDPGSYTGLRFVVGVAPEMNHLESASEAPPLNVSGLYWSWQGGYRYARFDVKTAATDAYSFHLGATGCSGDPVDGYTCQNDNLATIELPAFNAASEAVVLDLGAFFSPVDLEAPLSGSDGVQGCMSFTGDPECAPLYAGFGLDYEDSVAGAQTIFSAGTP